MNRSSRAKPRATFARIGRDRDRVAVVDDERLDPRPEAAAVGERFAARAQQVVADRAHVDRPRPARAEQIGALQRGVVARVAEPSRRRQQQAAGPVAPGADQARQDRDQPGRVAAAARPLHAVVDADRRRRERAVVARQRSHLGRVDAADLGGALGRPLQRALAQLGPAVDVALDVVVVEPVVDDELVHHGERERAVAARQEGDVLVALLGRVGAARVDADQLRAGALGLLRVAPEVQVRGDRVAAPDDDQPALGVVLDVHADLGAVGRGERLAAGRRADRPVEQRRAEGVEEAPGHALALHHAHGPGVAVGDDRLGVGEVGAGDRLQARGDVVERLVPAHRHEPAAALGADAFQRPQHAIGVVRALGVARNLGAQRAVRRRMERIAVHLHRPAVLDRDDDGAGVRAVVRTGGADKALRHRQTMAQRPAADKGRRVNCPRSGASHASHRIHPRRRGADRRASGATSTPIPSFASRSSAPRT